MAKKPSKRTTRWGGSDEILLDNILFVGGESFHYAIENDVEKWIEKVNQWEYPEWYILINVLEISKEFAKKYDGALNSM